MDLQKAIAKDETMMSENPKIYNESLQGINITIKAVKTKTTKTKNIRYIYSEKSYNKLRLLQLGPNDEERRKAQQRNQEKNRSS